MLVRIRAPAGCLLGHHKSSPVQIWVCRGGAHLVNLCYLQWVASLVKEDHILYLALISARSIADKIFMLNDFFISHELDFVTEGNLDLQCRVSVAL